MSQVIIAGDTSGTITLQAPAVSGSTTLTLPATTDTLVGRTTTDTLTNKSIVATQLTGTIASARLPAGSVLQVVQATKTDTFSTASTSYTDVTGLSVSITPSSASNKILVFMNASVAAGNGSDINHAGIQIVRGSTAIFIGDARGTRMQATAVVNTATAGQMNHPSAVYLDSPATTSATTYKLQIKTTNGSYTANVNRSGRDANDSLGFDGTAASSITVMEISA